MFSHVLLSCLQIVAANRKQAFGGLGSLGLTNPTPVRLTESWLSQQSVRSASLTQ